ncbi:DUF202 domain-containing protein [Actinacidiphila oryziradicis]|jgi:uncharacterized membrane protein YidH (DUF202 family)|uniref:DUF202 domain-containing protein n=1 Tax=Actinacidiphila oryziradicis TaxID=2571141 RepID=A0A4V5MZT5_9ACTN|nr:DUF202 domain-containing protein [Actinacidiphila oryziradicis]MCW2873759.1 hypothetical protein [Actinacidiphila oryziradicis]TKA09079.1 DUF202 domain-containing protein [Actinacidiphila oryziradicis]
MQRAARDPGLQPERTRLAWQRTVLSCAVAGVLAGRLALRHGLSPLSDTALALCALAWLTFLAAAQRRARALATEPPPALSTRTAVLAAGCTVALAVFGTLVLF